MTRLEPIDRPTREELELAQRVRALYLASPYQELRRVDCLFAGGRLVLTGSVSTFYLKQLAQSLVTSEFGQSLNIDNSVRVTPAEISLSGSSLPKPVTR